MHKLKTLCQPSLNAGLLFLRLSSAFMLFYVHGWPKLINHTEELARIEDPFGLGAQFSLLAAIFAEVICPPLIAIGFMTRLATLPVISVLAVALFFVHSHWSIAEGQFGWLLMITFMTILICGPGEWSIDAKNHPRKAGGPK